MFFSKFTAALWQNGECLPAVVISNDLSHSKESILIFLEKVLSILLQSDAKVLHIWSDIQVPNSRIASFPNFPGLKKHLLLKSTGIFLHQATAKDQFDRIGGTIKRIATNVVIFHKGMITDSITFADAVESKSKVKVFHITSQDVADRMAEFGLHQLALPGISWAHHLEFSGNIIIMHLYPSTTYTINNLPEDTLNLKLLMKQRSKSIAKYLSLLCTILQHLAKKTH